MAFVNGTAGNDFIHRAGDGNVPPAGFTEINTVTTGSDTIAGGAGNDVVFGDAGADTAVFDPATDGSDATNLGSGLDSVQVADTGGQVRLTFTSAEVGNDIVNDSGTLTNQDGGLAVRFQTEDATGNATGQVSRFDDEGITFAASGTTTFDVRDLVSGVQRGDQFRTAVLGTLAADTFSGTVFSDYINAGQGDDTLSGGTGNDFLVGGAGNDALDGGADSDSFIGGSGDDRITGGAGLSDFAADTLIFNVSTDGADTVDLGGGADVVNVNAAAATNVRLTFTSLEVGNDSTSDSKTMANQDGGLAVRLQAEDATGALTGGVTRVDDEGVTFVGGTLNGATAAPVTFDVRDLVSGAARGETFEVVSLGTAQSETLTAVQSTRSYYLNAGAGNDTVLGGSADDFLVGGAGDDSLIGGSGRDSFIGGGGNDTYYVDRSDETITDVVGGGTDTVISSASYDVRGRNIENVTLTGSADINVIGQSLKNTLIGNSGINRIDGGIRADTMMGMGGDDTYVVDNSGDRVIDELGGGFDTVETSVSFSAVGQNIEAITLTGSGNINATGQSVANVITGNSGDNTIDAGLRNDTLNGKAGNDTLIGGGSADTFVFDTALNASANVDTITDFSVPDDVIRLENAIFAGLVEGALAAGAFMANLSGQATESDDRIIYETDTGKLFFDSNGSDAGGSTQFALLSNKAALSAADFIVV